MGRFSNLEFNSGSEHKEQLGGGALPPAARAVKDHAHFLAEARASLGAGQFERALRQFARVLEFDPRNVEAWTGQVRMLIELGQYTEANGWADRGLEVLPDAAELLAAKSVALARLGDLKAAQVFSDSSMAEGRETPYLWLARGDVQLACREQRAGYCLDKACSLAPADWVVRWLAGRVLFFYRRFAEALRFAQQAVAAHADAGVLWILMARAQWALGFGDQAKLSLRQARECGADGDEVAALLKEMYQTGPAERLWAWCRRFLPA